MLGSELSQSSTTAVTMWKFRPGAADYVVWSFRVTREDLRTCWDHLPFRASPSCGAWVRTAQACRVLGSCPGAPLLLCLSLHLAAGAGMKQNHWGEVCREGLVFARVHSALA